MTLRTRTYNDEQYTLVPKEWADCLIPVPDDLPGVTEHSGEPATFRIPKSGVNNGFYYVDDIDGENDRFKLLWEPLFTHPAPEQLPKPHEVRLVSDFSVQATFNSCRQANEFARAIIAKDRGQA